MPTEPAQVTDTQIGVIRNNVQIGCIQRGLQRGAPDDEVRALCACIAGVMRDPFTQDESRWLVVASFRNQDGIAEAMFERHRDAMMACKAPWRTGSSENGAACRLRVPHTPAVKGR